MINRRLFLQGFAVSSLAVLCAQGCFTGHTAREKATSAPTLTAKPPRSTAAGAGTSLRVAFPGAAKQLDPAFYSVIEEHQIGFALFDGLVWIDHTLTPQPMLAESWEPNLTLRSWTFKLREDVYFHHGLSFSAEDVVYTFARLLDPKIGSTFRSSLNVIDKVEAIDQYTVRFRLRSPSAELPLLLGAPQARIVPHDLSNAVLAVKPAGTGPYQLSDHTIGERTRVQRNPKYWQANQPRLETIEFLFIPYEQQVAKLRSNSVDLLMQVGTEEIDDLMADPTISINETPSGAYQNIVMRATTKPFENKLVREALKYCIDRRAVQAQVLRGRGEPGNDHPVASISPFWADLPLRAYDPEQARSLLAKAGYKQGLQLDLLTSTIRPGMEEMAHAFAALAKAAGVTIRVVRVPAQVYWSDYAGRVPFHTGNWGFRPSIDETFKVAYYSSAKGNESNWRNPDLDALIDNASGERDRQKRQALYRQAQELLMTDGAVIIPYFKPTIIAMRSAVQGITLHPAGWLDFRTATLAGA